MTYREYFDEHETENISWCKPYTCTTDAGDYAIIMYEGEAIAIKTPTGEAHRYNDTLTDNTMEQFARAVNPHYDMFAGYSDEYIALDSMHETGCAFCPFRNDCEPMSEEINSIDYR